MVFILRNILCHIMIKPIISVSLFISALLLPLPGSSRSITFRGLRPTKCTALIGLQSGLQTTIHLRSVECQDVALPLCAKSISGKCLLFLFMIFYMAMLIFEKHIVCNSFDVISFVCIDLNFFMLIRNRSEPCPHN